MFFRQYSASMLKVLLTFIMATMAAVVLWYLYAYYTYAPQTRDGKVRVDVVPLASDVSGRIEEVRVHDNQPVRRGDVLFIVDQVRLANDVKASEANFAMAQAQFKAAERESRRYRALQGVASQQERDNRETVLEQARALVSQALAELERTRIDYSRAVVRSPVNGIVTNLSLRPGAYAMTGQPVMALVDSDSYYVAGYFEETKLARMQVGMSVSVRLMGESRTLHGHVEGFAAGIEDRERVTVSGSLLANVNPTFSWVRLAQRVPIRIALDEIPQGIALVAGRTATVSLDSGP
ncbi:efflux RND transporter periplasmic adaptor subunit [Pseudomonas mandelii]|uniref:efflux RND transporter periplasmic adaptor subunit n=1 Tax=Pseudomonas mandelii TaxID=75612 RepID=UPI00209DB2FF|nr:HlyD family secretion protein [Pseudomonas mandelii]MCO8310962.1 HlyD family secretion protein [Pseudomonas mandelii]